MHEASAGKPSIATAFVKTTAVKKAMGAREVKMEKNILTLSQLLRFWTENGRDLAAIKTILDFCRFKEIKLNFGAREIDGMMGHFKDLKRRLEKELFSLKEQYEMKAEEKKRGIANAIRDRSMFGEYLKRSLDELNKQE